MRILMVGNFLSQTTGVRGVCEEIADRLQARSHRVLRTSSRRHRLDRLRDMVWSTWSRRHDYDVAHLDLFSGSALVWGETVARLLHRIGRPYLVTVHGGDLPALATSARSRLRWILARADRVLAPSPYLARELSGLRDDIETLPNAIDLKDYPYRARSAPRPDLVWLRAFHQVYAPEVAVRVLSELLGDLPKARLEMMGPDKGDGSWNKARSLVAELALEDSSTLRGAVLKSEVGQSLSGGDIFLNTSRIDNAPVTVVEAMACGLCVVSTDVGGMRDLIEDGATGLLVPPDDPPAMARAVRRLLEEPGLARRLSTAARESVQANDWERVLPRWEELLIEATRSGDAAA